MDASTLLEQYTQDLSNLPSELAYLLEELRDKDLKTYDTKKKLQQRDSQLHKYIKQNGSLVKHPREDQIYAKNKEDFDKALKLQEEKCVLANTALFLISKHLTRLEKDIERLEQDGVIPPLTSVDSDDEEEQAGNNLLEMLSSQISNTSLDSSSSMTRRAKAQRSKSRQTTPSSSGVMGGHGGPGSAGSTLAASGPGSISLKGRMMSDELSDIDMDDIMVKTPKKKSIILEHGASGTVTIPKAPNQISNEEDELYCFCQQVSYGNMIACDNSNCKFEWFHYDCVGLKEPPQGIWYCPDCRKNMELNNKKKERKKK